MKKENMFFNEPGKPSKQKRAIYLTVSAILGILLGIIASGMIEMKYLSLTIDPFNEGYAQLQLLQGMFLLSGATLGFFVGKFWWRKIYIERVWLKKR